MPAEIITKDDLELFRLQLLKDLKNMLGKDNNEEPKKWLKSYQVKNLLKISNGTLQNLRVNGTIQFTKIGGILYYKYDEIMHLLQGD